MWIIENGSLTTRLCAGATGSLLMEPWQPNFFQFYLRVVQRLLADLKLPFQLNADLFRKGEAEVHEAIKIIPK